jgi:hypothetical protein
MLAKMRAVSLTAFQRSGAAIPLRIRIPCLSVSALEPMVSFGSHGAGGNAEHRTAPGWTFKGISMEGKARFIFPVLISALIVFVVSAVVTFTNIGLRGDFVPRWLKAFITGWPVAAVLAFFAVPHVRRATELIVRLIDG